MIRLQVAAIFLFLSLACKEQAPNAHLADTNVPFAKVGAEITITHQSTGPDWLVSYKFSQAIRKIYFQVEKDQPRPRSWVIEGSDDFEIATNAKNTMETIRRKDDAPFHSFTVSFSLETAPDDGRLSIAFSDGAVFLNTLYFDGYVVEGEAGKTFYAQLVPTYRLIPRRNEFASTIQATDSRELRFARHPRSGVGYYLYFGKNRPLTYEGLPFMADPSIPRAWRDFAVQNASKAFRFYQRIFGELPFSPGLIISHRKKTGINQVDGAAFWGQLLINFHGNDPEVDDAFIQGISHAAFHEMSHLWNAVAYQTRANITDKKRLFEDVPESTYDGWIEEGGANALAYAARKIVFQATPSSEENDALLLSDCKWMLKGRRVIDRPQNPDMLWTPYFCGQLLQHMAVDLIRKYRSDYTIFDLWKRIFALSRDNQYDNQTFFAAVQSDAPQLPAFQVESLKKMLITKADDLEALVNSLRK